MALTDRVAADRLLRAKRHSVRRRLSPREPDPVNAMLSLAYTVLSPRSYRARRRGLTPAMRHLSRAREGRAGPAGRRSPGRARHLGDRVVLTLIRKGQVMRAVRNDRRALQHGQRRTGGRDHEMKRRLSVTSRPAKA